MGSRPAANVNEYFVRCKDSVTYLNDVVGCESRMIAVDRAIRCAIQPLFEAGSGSSRDFVLARLDGSHIYIDPARNGYAEIRGAAVWALRRLDPHRAEAMRLDRLSREGDSSVRAEWDGVV